MATSPFSLLLRHLHHHHRRYNHLLLPPLIRHLSLSSAPSSSDPPKPDSLSARLSFVFDKIDDIEKERTEKDSALQRIRAWRQSKRQPPADELNNAGIAGDEKLGLGVESENAGGNVAAERGEKEVGAVEGRTEIEVAHPWPEWIELMERLVKQNYFDHKRIDEDKLIEKLGGVVDDGGGEVEGSEDFMKDWKSVHAAIVNFGKDRFDIFRSLLRQDIQILVGYGCPSTDKKVVFSSKLLRKHVHLDEGDVCSSCSLRTTCERAYLVTNKEDEARTIDVMRVLLAYGFDSINGSVENKSLLKQKSVKAAVRKLLHEVVRLSAVPIDPSLPPPVIKKRPPKVKQPPPPPKRRIGRDDIEMKKGDWLCPKCNFMNFAKNVVCLQCDAKRPKRQLLPGEWECPQCNFLNYRRNMSCFNCEHKRPPDEYMENQAQERQNRSTTRLERVPDRSQVSNAWNFDFDDDESDGADVAAFEYADPRATNEDRYLDSPPDGNFGGAQENHRLERTSRHLENENSMSGQLKHNVGFNDFDDEDDDIDSYELDSLNRNQRREVSSVPFSDVEDKDYSESESDEGLVGFSGRRPSSYPKSSKRLHQKGALPNIEGNDLDFGSDEDLPVHPKWKSSHVTDSGVRDGALRGPKRTYFESDDDDDKLVFGSEDDHEESSAQRQGRGKFRDSGTRGYRQADDLDDEFTSRYGKQQYRDSGQNGLSQQHESNRRGRREFNFVNKNDFDGDSDRPSRGSRRNQRGSFDNHGNDFGRPRNQRGSFDNHGDDFVRSSRGSRGNLRGSFDNHNDDFGRPSRGSHGNRSRSFDNYGQQKMSGRPGGRQNFNGSAQRETGNRGHRRSNGSDDWSNEHSGRPVRQHRNVR